MVNFVNGDLFSTPAPVIAHQVNCMGVMGSGVAKTVKELYPEVYEDYKKAITQLNHECLGGCLLSKTTHQDKYIANLFGQYYYRGCPEEPFPKADRYTNYEALYRSLVRLRSEMEERNLGSVAFPYKLGSSRGGADWNVVLEMIKSVFNNSKTEVWIYRI